MGEIIIGSLLGVVNYILFHKRGGRGLDEARQNIGYKIKPLLRALEARFKEMLGEKYGSPPVMDVVKPRGHSLCCLLCLYFVHGYLLK